MEEDLKRPSHISYKEYQKKVTKKPNEGIIIFVSAFFILLLLFLGIAKQLSPEIDVGIGDDENSTSTEEIASDFVVMAVGARKNLPELSACPLPLHYIGDCAGERPSNIDHAIKSAYDVACEI